MHGPCIRLATKDGVMIGQKEYQGILARNVTRSISNSKAGQNVTARKTG